MMFYCKRLSFINSQCLNSSAIKNGKSIRSLQYKACKWITTHSFFTSTTEALESSRAVHQLLHSQWSVVFDWDNGKCGDNFCALESLIISIDLTNFDEVFTNNRSGQWRTWSSMLRCCYLEDSRRIHLWKYQWSSCGVFHFSSFLNNWGRSRSWQYFLQEWTASSPCICIWDMTN